MRGCAAAANSGRGVAAGVGGVVDAEDEPRAKRLGVIVGVDDDVEADVIRRAWRADEGMSGTGELDCSGCSKQSTTAGGGGGKETSGDEGAESYES